MRLLVTSFPMSGGSRRFTLVLFWTFGSCRIEDGFAAAEVSLGEDRPKISFPWCDCRGFEWRATWQRRLEFWRYCSGYIIGPKQHRQVLVSIYDLVRRAGLATPESGLDVLRLAECGIQDPLTNGKARGVLGAQDADTEVKAEGSCRLRAHVSMADVGAEELCVSWSRVE